MLLDFTSSLAERRKPYSSEPLYRRFAKNLGEFVPEGMSSFRELFQMILEIGKRKKFTLFIDEFQEFDNINAGIFSDI